MPLRHALNACALAVTCPAVSLAHGAQAPPVTEVVPDNGLRLLVLEGHRNPILLPGAPPAAAGK